MNKRSELPELERAVSNALDDWLARMHGIFSSWANPDIFLNNKEGIKNE